MFLEVHKTINYQEHHWMDLKKANSRKKSQNSSMTNAWS